MGSGPFRHRMSVRFADVDHAGIVYYPVFFHYFHLALEALFSERVGARSYAKLLDQERVGLPHVSSHCDFFAPLRFGDSIEIEMSVEKLGQSSVTFRYRVYRCADEDRPEAVLAAEGTNVCATVDLEAFRAVAIPEPLRAVFAELHS